MNVEPHGLSIELTRSEADDLYNDFEIARRSLEPEWWKTTMLKKIFDELDRFGIQGTG